MTPITNRFCSICLDTKPANVFNCLPCLHWFCRTCLAKLVQNVCPLCRLPFEPDLSFSSPINIGLLSRSAPAGRESTGRLLLNQVPVLSRSADSTTRDLEMLVNFTGIQNVDSLSQVLTDLEGRERTHYRRRRRRKRRRRRQRHHSPPPPSPSTSPSPLLSAIFQFDDDTTERGDGDRDSDAGTDSVPPAPEPCSLRATGADDSKSRDDLDEPNSSEPKLQRTGRGDRWAYLNRQRSHRSGR